VDVDAVTGTGAVETMLAAKQRWAGRVDLQVVAFPQEGLMADRDNRARLRDALALGADVVGGIPAIEADDRAARAHIDFALGLAVEFNTAVDMHIDETDDPRSRTLAMLAEATIAAGWQGRVTAVHCCALAAYDDAYAARVIEQVAEAGLHVITNPPVNLVLQGRHDAQPVRRGVTRVKELLAAGVNVACGQDNLRDAFYPFGQADMLEVAFVTALATHMTGRDEIQTVFDMPRRRAAAVLGLPDYGLRPGGPADIVLLPVASAAEALAERPPRPAVLRGGRLLCRTTQTVEHWPDPLT
jgi:cytosine deaminase